MDQSCARHVLLVHKDDAFRGDVARALLATGYEVEIAEDGADALSAFRHHRHAAIVSAVELPKNDGLAFIRLVRADPRGARVPVLMVSLIDLAKRRRAAEELGVAGLFVQPVDIAQLVGRLAELTGGSQEPVRDAQRFQHAETVEVRCEGWSHFVDMVTDNVSKGGMFIASNNPPPVFTRVRVRIASGDGKAEFVVDGDVRHIVSNERAKARGVSPGMGIRFDELDEESARQVENLLRRASNPTMAAVRISAPPPVDPPAEEELSADDKLRMDALESELGRLREQDFFQRLELSYEANAVAIRQAFRERARPFHPDRYARLAAPLRRAAQEIYLLLNEARKELQKAAVREQLRRSHSGPSPASIRPRRVNASSDNGSPSRSRSKLQPRRRALRDTQPRDPSPGDAPFPSMHDTLSRDTSTRPRRGQKSMRETLPRDSSHGAPEPRRPSLRDTLPRDSSPGDESPQRTRPRDAPTRGAQPRETPEREPSPERRPLQRETLPRETLPRETLQRETLQRETLQRENVQRETRERDTSARRAIALAMQSLNEERYQDALDRFAALVERGATNRDVLVSIELARAHLFLEQDKPDDARRHFERACTIDPGCVRAIRAVRAMNAASEEQDRGLLGRLLGR